MPIESRRPHVLGVHSLDHFTVQVPSLIEAHRFYEAFGLDVRHYSRELRIGAFGVQHDWMKVVTGDTKALQQICFAVFEDDFDRFRALARQQQLAVTSRADTSSLLIRDPHGVLLELRVAEKTSLNSRPESPAPPARGDRGAPFRDQTSRVRPKRMAHALFFTPDVKQTVEFYCRVLGLRVSDYPGPVVFLHGAHGSDHHLIAFAQSDAPGYHHSAWDVASIEEVGLGAMQMQAAGYTQGWGVGRHVLGSNYFYYARDPWGSYAEYSFDIDYIPVETDWVAGIPDPENSFYLWGPAPPEDFVVNYEATR